MCKFVFLFTGDALLVGQEPVEERSWRELFLIPHNNDLASTSDGSERVFRTHLAGFVDYEEIK